MTPDERTGQHHANAAESALRLVRTSSNDPTSALERCTAEALLAIYYQLRVMESSQPSTKGFADLADSMDRLARKMK
jgi:hypothetical protein